MKNAIPWVLVVLLLAGFYFVYSGGKDRDAELEKARKDSDELRTEVQRLKQQPDNSAELEKARKDADELLRLRSEIGQLRDENKKLTSEVAKAVAQGTQLQNQTQQQLSQLAAENQNLRGQSVQLQAVQAKVQTDACMNNLRQINAAKQQWALENQKPANAIPSPKDLAAYFPSNSFPICPGGGVYTINPVGGPPACNLPAHGVLH